MVLHPNTQQTPIIPDSQLPYLFVVNSFIPAILIQKIELIIPNKFINVKFTPHLLLNLISGFSSITLHPHGFIFMIVINSSSGRFAFI